MKKTVSYRSLIFLIPSMMLFSSANSQIFLPVKGTGPSIDKKLNVSDFKGIDVSGGIDVILVQGSSESLTLTAQENLFEYITAKVDNGTLKIYTRNNLRPTQPMKARITFKEITNLKVSGGGDTHGETPVNVEALDVNISGGGDFSSAINSEELKCNISGGGDAKIEGKTKVYNISVSGGGDLESKVSAGSISCRIIGGGDLFLRNEAQASKADIEINGGGDVDMKMSAEKLKCSVSGGGDALIAGQASEFEINIDGGGDVDAKNLSTEITSFNVGGGSDIRVNASKELSGHISGGGDVYYSGDPAKVSVDARGGSEVHKE
jgi:Putative auto-transporter adhesin, head GIN domain